jgi:hypothetical protein
MYERPAQSYGLIGPFCHAATPLEAVALGLPTSSMNVSNTSCQRLRVGAARTTTTGRSRAASFGFYGQELPGGMSLSGMVTGRLFTTGSDAGPLAAPLSRMHGTCRVNSMPRVASTGPSWARIAPSSRKPEPPRADRTTIKRGSNQARRRRRPGTRL